MTWPFDAPSRCPRCVNHAPLVRVWDSVQCLVCSWEYVPDAIDPEQARREATQTKREWKRRNA